LDLGIKLAESRYAIITIGGSGYQGWPPAKALPRPMDFRSVLFIYLPYEQMTTLCNSASSFSVFFISKVMFMNYSMAFVCSSRRFDTLDALFESLLLLHARRKNFFPCSRRFILEWIYWLPAGTVTGQWENRGGRSSFV